MSTQVDNHPIRLADLRHDCETKPAAEFQARYGDAFLLYQGAPDSLAPASRGQTKLVDTLPGDSAEAVIAQTDFVIYPLRATGRSPFPNFISIGRTGNNDVIFEDSSLSKFHAYLRQVDGGDYVIQDAGSKNGTFVDDVAVPARDRGAPQSLHSGARVRLGRIDLIFLRYEELRRMASMLPKR